jgi:ATP-dependent DNA helicase PIF1
MAKTLTSDQKRVLDTILNNAKQSVLITGPAGTGKSFLLKAITAAFETSKEPIRFAMTASTGSAAVLVKGRTLHSFMGIGLAKSPATALVAKMHPPQLRRLRMLHTLILDEVSMISAGLFDLIDEVFRLVRKNSIPFGGVRGIFVGDACQLPPVDGEYFFKSNVWNTLSPKVFSLTELIRQSGDTNFQELLQRLRWGTMTAEDYTLLETRVRPGTSTESGGNATETEVKPTRLYAMNRDVDKENDKAFHAQMLRVASKDHVRTYATYFNAPQDMSKTAKAATIQKLKQYAASCRIPDAVLLCYGAQVMITWNVGTDQGIVNGTRGVITAFANDGVQIQMKNRIRTWIPYIQISMPSDEESSHRSSLLSVGEDPLRAPEFPSCPTIYYLPVRLAYALSIHKSQGITLDSAEMDLGASIFEYGQAYTALSRMKSLDSVVLTALSPKAFKTHPDVLAFYRAAETDN